MDVILLGIGLLVIFAGAELFTNGIEWFGRHLDLAEGAVGSVLAAVGTALPETMIPLVAIVLAAGNPDPHAAREIGVGAILGAPFMLGTLAMFVTGAAVILVRKSRRHGTSMAVDTRVLRTDLGYFALGYGVALAVALLPTEMTWARYLAVVFLIGMYLWYVRGHLKAEAPTDPEPLAPLRLHRIDRRAHRANPEVPRLRVVNLQVLLALFFIVGGAVVFVDGVENLSTSFGFSPALLALVVAPIATELPEKFNSIIWVRQGKDTLALGNITGAMVFQSCIPTTIALLLAAQNWSIGGASLISFASALIVFISIAVIFLPSWRTGRLTAQQLLLGGIFYLGYLGLVGLYVTGVI